MNISLPRILKIRSRDLPLLVAACGILGLILRWLLNTTGMDEKNLLIPWHPAWIALCLLTAAAAVIILVGVLPIRGPAAHKAAFPLSIPGAAGCFLAACSAAVTGAEHLRAGVPMDLLHGVLILAAAVAFILVGLCRLTEKQPMFLFHVAICVYFVLQMLTLYQTMSFNPQIQTYCFQLFACIALAMTAYQLAAFDMGRGSHRKLWAWGLAAAYLCCLSAASGLFFITGGIWALVNLSSLRFPRQRRTIAAEYVSNIE